MKNKDNPILMEANHDFQKANQEPALWLSKATTACYALFLMGTSAWPICSTSDQAIWRENQLMEDLSENK